MEKEKLIASFQVNHLNLYPGVYVSRVDSMDGMLITTYDLRMTAPNREEALAPAVSHSIEHLGATYLRNESDIKDKIVYFGPMGCLTGAYLILFGSMTPEDLIPYVEDMCRYIIGFEGEIPGAKPEQCGNYSLQDLEGAKLAAKKYLDELKYKRTVYPE